MVSEQKATWNGEQQSSFPPLALLPRCSMGGAIAVRVAAELALPTLAGLIVVDVVEVRDAVGSRWGSRGRMSVAGL